MLCAVMLLCAFSVAVSATQNTNDIIILYENDVHCNIEGYTKLAAMKNELKKTYAHVGVVSSGDYIQGTSYGVVSKGEYIVNLMNLVGYDALTIGNHEFDYQLPRLEELIGMMKTKPVCCNFQKIGQESSYFTPYSLVSYGDVKIAYVGITTPATITSVSPAQFKDADGNYIFTFHPNDLYQVVQNSIDAALADGADHVIALSHVGDKEMLYNVEDLIANTTGLDVVLDAHSHSVIEESIVTDQSGNRVVLSSTGTKFEYIGKLTISGDSISTELVKTQDYTATDPAVDAYLRQIEEEHATQGDRKFAFSHVKLVTHDENGNRLVRVSETNLGNFCSDALRSTMNADIGYINGGGLRAEIAAGDVTYNDLLNVFPFNNTVVLAKIDGHTFRDMLEMALLEWPEECSFPHISGVTFSVNTQIPSSVVINEHGEFCGISGPYRVYNLRVLNRETGNYEPMDLSKTYTIASNDYYLLQHGSGMTMLEKVEILQNSGILDVEALEHYIIDQLGGIIGEEYRHTSPRITFTDGELIPADEKPQTLLILCLVSAGIVVLLAVTFTVLKARRKTGK